MIPEIDIWRAATLMLKRYGERALEGRDTPGPAALTAILVPQDRIRVDCGCLTLALDLGPANSRNRRGSPVHVRPGGSA